MDDFELAEKQGQYLKLHRLRTGMTKPEFARRARISVNTVTNWENGTSAPDMRQLRAWFRAAGANERQSMMEYAFLDDPAPEGDDQVILDQLNFYAANVATPEDRQVMHFCFLGQHGSDPMCSVIEWAANLRCPMMDRVGIATMVVNHLQLRQARGELLPGPDIDVPRLLGAVDMGAAAAIEGRSHYYQLTDPVQIPTPSGREKKL